MIVHPKAEHVTKAIQIPSKIQPVSPVAIDVRTRLRCSFAVGFFKFYYYWRMIRDQIRV